MRRGGLAIARWIRNWEVPGSNLIAVENGSLGNTCDQGLHGLLNASDHPHLSENEE